MERIPSGFKVARRRFQPADLPLRGAKFAREVALGEAGLFAQGCYLQGHIPRLTGLLEPLGEIRVLHLLFEVTVEIGLAQSAKSFVGGRRGKGQGGRCQDSAGSGAGEESSLGV